MIGLFPSDHVIGDEKRYRETLERGIEIAAAGENIVVLGIRPTRAETGYGYIEAGQRIRGRRAARAPLHREAGCREGRRIRCGGKLFLEQRNVSVERAHAGRMRCASILPKTAPLLEEIAAAFGTRKFARDLSQALSQVRKHQRRLRGAGAAFGEGRAGSRTFSAFPRISAGTILARGRRCTSITRRRAARQKAI